MPPGGMPPGGMPPGGAPQGGRPNRGMLFALIGGGAALVLVVAVVAVVLATRTGPAYASLPGCDDILPEDALAGIGDLEGADVDEETGGAFGEDEDIVGGLICTDGGGGEDLPRFNVSIALYDPATRERDYRQLEREFERATEDYDDILAGEMEADDEDYLSEPLEELSLSVGDDRRGYLMSDDYMTEDVEYGVVYFRMSNVFAIVSYYGEDEPVEEKGDAVVDLAQEVASGLKSEATRV
ncbi:hypothetical protein O4J56_09280 [Nocardiopsis sp. RSe5-2]|uniref:DUF3558 domain-containing protein n=1 Tax=Nocardiopsis endophytica TaxID=3018445 RepID=A0ABT4U1J8_9ACTN|nr:hypothetical protein [Nocardiopsis endophytica]MDA2810824.1 hypothetical protein [Nocardiopsis endophytica]